MSPWAKRLMEAHLVVAERRNHCVHGKLMLLSSCFTARTEQSRRSNAAGCSVVIDVDR